MNALILLTFLTLLCLVLVPLNIWHHRHCMSLSPEERAREDEETRAELQIW